MFPDKPISAQPAETRMGKGKGEPEYWAAVVKPGKILYEVGGVPEGTAKQVLNRMAHKMPLRCRFVNRRHKV
jgi:large subunit ribosomal protein L16